MLDRAARDRPIENWELPIRRFSKRILSSLNASVYRLTDGQVAGTIPGGAPLLLLERTSSISGKVRTVTLLYAQDDQDPDTYIVVGSSGGGPRDPDWITYIDEGSLQIRVGADRLTVTPTVLGPGEGEYARYWELLQSRYFFFEQYRTRVAGQSARGDREDYDGVVRDRIPIAVLTVTGSDS